MANTLLLRVQNGSTLVMWRIGFRFQSRCILLICLIIPIFVAVTQANFSNNSTNKEWCYFKSLSDVEKMSFCKFKCWAQSSIHLPTDNARLRNSIVSLNIQITDKVCENEIGAIHLSSMEKLSIFLITGHIRTFNLTFLVSQAPKLRKLSISSQDLRKLFVDNMTDNQITSLHLLGVFDPIEWQFIKSSSKTLKSFYLTLNRKVVIPEKLFYQMPEIQFINLLIITEKMNSNSFSSLPKLSFLSIHNNFFHYPIKLQNLTFNNLPSLRTLKIINFEIETINSDDQFCEALSGNIESFILETSSIVFIERCLEAWVCVDCGAKDSDSSQIMEFRSLSTNFKARNVVLDDILPNPSTTYFLNTTKLLLIDTFIPIITNTSIARFPLMTHYHHHRSWRLHERNMPFISLGDIDRFIDNPFEMLLRNQSRLREVKISIATCDCVTFEVYNFLISYNVSVSLYCRNLASEYEVVNTDSWIDTPFFEDLMRVKCSANSRYFNLCLIIIISLCFQIISFSF